METKIIDIKPAEWQQFATGDGITTAQVKDGVAMVYIGDATPASTSAPNFTFSEGDICGPIDSGAKAWVKGHGSLVFVEIPKQK